MADLQLRQRDSEYDEKTGSDSVEKISIGSNGKPVDDIEIVKEVEALEDRIQHDEATEDEYRVGEAYEVAIKVRTMDPSLLIISHKFPPQVLSTRDEPELPALTFRTFFLGLGFSAFGA